MAMLPADPSVSACSSMTGGNACGLIGMLIVPLVVSPLALPRHDPLHSGGTSASQRCADAIAASARLIQQQNIITFGQPIHQPVRALPEIPPRSRAVALPPLLSMSVTSPPRLLQGRLRNCSPCPSLSIGVARRPQTPLAPPASAAGRHPPAPAGRPRPLVGAPDTGRNRTGAAFGALVTVARSSEQDAGLWSVGITAPPPTVPQSPAAAPTRMYTFSRGQTQNSCYIDDSRSRRTGMGAAVQRHFGRRRIGGLARMAANGVTSLPCLQFDNSFAVFFPVCG